MRYHRNRNTFDAEGFQLRTPQRGECFRADEHRRHTAPQSFDRVVDTPRRARTSIAAAGDDEIAALLDILQHAARSGHRSSGLAMLDHAADAVIALEHLREIVDEVIEVG